MVQEVLQRRQEPWRWGVVVGHWELPVTNRELSLKLIILQLYEKLLKKSTSTFLLSFDTWSKLKRWKGLISGCFMSCLKVKKKKNPNQSIVLKCCLLFFYTTTMSNVSIGLWCAMTSGFYTTTSDDQLSGWTEMKLQRTSQSQTCPPQKSWRLFDGLLSIWSTTAFWILVKQLYLRSKLIKPGRCMKNCNACSWHWSTERAHFFSRTVPDRMSKPWSTGFYNRNKQTYFSLAKMYWL